MGGRRGWGWEQKGCVVPSWMDADDRWITAGRHWAMLGASVPSGVAPHRSDEGTLGKVGAGLSRATSAT